MFQILVVEDDASLRKLMSAALKQHGYSCHTANDGVEALDVMEKTNIDLIISDVMMPNMDGYELTRQLRRAKYDLPILMVTAKETFEDKQEGFIAGTDDYMVKPIDINEMILRVGALLRRSKMASEHSLVVGRSVLADGQYRQGRGDDTLKRVYAAVQAAFLSKQDIHPTSAA